MSDVTTSPPVRSRWLALVVLCAGMLMIILDGTIVNVALPAIQEDLDFSQSDLAWVVNAYLIAFGGLLLLAGRIGDLMGQRRIFQGVGGALTSSVILGMVVTMFPEPREQAKAIGVYTFVAVAGGSIGLLLGGVLTETINWHWIFFVNAPIGVATALLAIRLVPEREGLGLAAGADLPGAFVARQARVANPLMPLRLFRSRTVSAANVVQALLVVGIFGMFFLGALYMQRVLGYDALQVGLAYLPMTVVMGTMSFRFTGQLNLRFGPQATLVPAMAFIIVA